jgi:hypothetical protein
MATIWRVSDTVVKVTGTAELFCGDWHLTTARKARRCRWSGRQIAAGEECYKPDTGSRYFRDDRMQKAWVDQIAVAPGSRPGSSIRLRSTSG